MAALVPNLGAGWRSMFDIHGLAGLSPRKEEIQEDCLTLEDWADRFSRNVSNYQSSQKIEDIIYNNLLMPIMLS